MSETADSAVRLGGRRDDDHAAKLLREAASEITQGLLVVDGDLTITFVNNPYRRFFGFAPDDPIVQPGQPLEAMLWTLAARGEYGPGQPGKHVEDRLRPVRDGSEYSTERLLSNGRYVEISGHPLSNGGYVFTFTDVTDRVEEKKRLDQLVRDRTEELHQVNSKLIDGIEYARLIQTGILPQKSFFDAQIGPNFLLFKPADIVGGDFYIGVKTDYGTYVGLGDCTGHGVPGAMMTMMAASVCRRAINETGVGGPAAVMMAIDRIVRINLHQTEAQVGPDNGLELTLCLLESDVGRVRVAGAGLDVFVQTKGRIDRVRGTKHGLGYGRQTSSATSIQETVFTEREAERIFLTSDGILDQSGGDKGYGYGRRRLTDALQQGANLSIEEQGAHLAADVETYSKGYVQRDDLAVLGFCLKQS
ncbi:PAS-domain containing protein [Pacificispira sp.]|uniref:PAS-domain containing protein n=1 Tax=Pacificispira sp. TaxID=2888761 RepID=UPI003BAB3D8A